ncbi:hypothetical protein [Cellulomonas phragmiteti]|uniref:Uncharacterized protein n=1 Tax=Cellulomonas phragmiteti TaxID=478780 RepID=A0ABQ4DMC8_9CELL|nr:hypothetical protein [Cellulomonas phragmiteti]GIG40499.1 hypothetical protein Cph01nite_22610 [Cellulomonas phragmiteti]
MSGVSEAVQGFHSKRTENPKTVLAFYATILGLALTADTALVGVLASTGESTWLIPWLILFAGTLSIGLLAAVFFVALRDPSKLMLGQVTGEQYVEIQKLTLTTQTADIQEVAQVTLNRIEGAKQ